MATALDTLHFKTRTREDHGSGMPTFSDFVISGKSLFDLTGNEKVSVFGDLYFEEHQFHVLKQLLLEEPSDLGNGRVAIYVCPECGSLSCGYYSVQVSMENGNFVWSDMRDEYEYLSLETRKVEMATFPVPGVKRFVFAPDQYRAALEKVISRN